MADTGSDDRSVSSPIFLQAPRKASNDPRAAPNSENPQANGPSGRRPAPCRRSPGASPGNFTENLNPSLES